jgi:hypothetical protein
MALVYNPKTKEYEHTIPKVIEYEKFIEVDKHKKDPMNVRKEMGEPVSDNLDISGAPEERERGITISYVKSKKKI